jgi:copper chaperone
MYEFKVEGMSCGGCVRSVTKSVLAVDSDAKVEVDLAGKSVRIDSQATLEAVRAAISDAGYPVTTINNG